MLSNPDSSKLKPRKSYKKVPKPGGFGTFWSCWADSNCRPHPYHLTGRFPGGLYSCHFPLSCVGSIYAPQYAVPISPCLSPLIPPEGPKCFQICFQFSRRHKQNKMRERDNQSKITTFQQRKISDFFIIHKRPRISCFVQNSFSTMVTESPLISQIKAGRSPELSMILV